LAGSNGGEAANPSGGRLLVSIFAAAVKVMTSRASTSAGDASSASTVSPSPTWHQMS